jgi:regulator of protease activity HflC (stomatin/prohibitin superfamily)
MILLALLIIVIALVAANVRIVPQAQAYVVEYLGKYRATWVAGLHIKVPFVERVVKKVSLKEQVLDFPPQPVITKDNVTMMVDSVTYCRVFDPRLYTYGVENPIVGLQNLSATTLRNIIGEMELDQTLTSRDAINAKMQSILDEATDSWGIKVTRVEIKNIKPPKEIEEVMTKQMRAERERRQTVLEAQAHQEAVVSRAEGDKKAKILSAEAERDAEAEGIRKLNEANISNAVLKLKGIDAVKDMADGRATKIYMPTDLTNILATLGVAGEAMGIGDALPVDQTPKAPRAPKKDPCITPETGAGGVEAAETTEQINADIEQRDPDNS